MIPPQFETWRRRYAGGESLADIQASLTARGYPVSEAIVRYGIVTAGGTIRTAADSRLIAKAKAMKAKLERIGKLPE